MVESDVSCNLKSNESPGKLGITKFSNELIVSFSANKVNSFDEYSL